MVSIDGTDISGATIDGTEVQEITMDGDVVWEAFDGPDSAVLHYPMLNRSGSTIEEQIEGSDGTAVGTTTVSNNYYEGYAEDGDGTDDYIELTDWSEIDWGSMIMNDWSIGLTVEGTDNDVILTGCRTSGAWQNRFGMGFHDATSDGVATMYHRDRGGNDNGQRLEGDTAINDGNKHRILWGGSGNSASDKRIYVDGSDETNIVTDDGDHSLTTNHSENWLTHASNDRGDLPHYPADAVLDNLIVYDAPPSEVVQDDYDLQPWT